MRVVTHDFVVPVKIGGLMEERGDVEKRGLGLVPDRKIPDSLLQLNTTMVSSFLSTLNLFNVSLV